VVVSHGRKLFVFVLDFVGVGLTTGCGWGTFK